MASKRKHTRYPSPSGHSFFDLSWPDEEVKWPRKKQKKKRAKDRKSSSHKSKHSGGKKRHRGVILQVTLRVPPDLYRLQKEREDGQLSEEDEEEEQAQKVDGLFLADILPKMLAKVSQEINLEVAEQKKD